MSCRDSPESHTTYTTQVNSSATEGKQVEEMIAGVETLAFTVLRKRGQSESMRIRNASESVVSLHTLRESHPGAQSMPRGCRGA